jgi:hypothetical protein
VTVVLIAALTNILKSGRLGYSAIGSDVASYEIITDPGGSMAGCTPAAANEHRP